MMAGLLACLCALPLLRKASLVAVPVIVWLPLALAGFIGLQSLLLPQVVDQHAGIAIGYLLWAALLMVLVGLLQQRWGMPRLAAWLAGGLLAAGLWASGRELLARLLAEADIWGGTGQPNHYGDLLALGGTSLLYLNTQTRLPKPLFMATGLFLMMGLSLTPSRSVWLYWLALALIAGRYRSAWLKPLGAGFVVYLLFQGLWSLDLFSKPQLTSAARVIAQTSGASPRWHIWQVAWELFLQQPVFGHGFGQFDWVYFEAGQHVADLPTRIEHAHNIFMHFLVELGIVPVLLLLAALVFWLKTLLPTRSDEIDSQASHAILKPWLLMLAAVLGIHSFLEYPLWHANFLGIAALILAMGEQRHWHLPLNKVGAALAGGFVSVSLVIATIHEWQYTRMELALLATLAKPTLQREQQLIDICQNLSSTAPLLSPYVPVVFTLIGHPENPEMREQMKVLADAAVRFTPTGYLVYRLSLLQALSDDTANARKTVDKALAAYPSEAVKFAEELLRVQEFEGGRIDVLMKQILPTVNKQLQASWPAKA